MEIAHVSGSGASKSGGTPVLRRNSLSNKAALLSANSASDSGSSYAYLGARFKHLDALHGEVAGADGAEGGLSPGATKPPKGELVFDCDFESGNLLSAQRVGDNEYELQLRHDSLNASKHGLAMHGL